MVKMTKTQIALTAIVLVVLGAAFLYFYQDGSGYFALGGTKCYAEGACCERGGTCLPQGSGNNTTLVCKKTIPCQGALDDVQTIR